MYPLGHVALGYLSGKIAAEFNKKDFNTLLIWIVSVSPDFDILIPNLAHRGPSHSAISAIAIFIPILIFNKNGLPYLVALLSHSLIGDYFTAYGCKLFWPLSDEWFVYDRAWSVQSRFGFRDASKHPK